MAVISTAWALDDAEFQKVSAEAAKSDNPYMKNVLSAVKENDAQDAIRAAAKAIRYQKKNNSAVLEVQQPEFGICVECDQLLELTNQVNAVLKKLGEAPEEVERLAVVSTYYHYVDKLGDPKCATYEDFNFTDEFRMPDLNDAIVIHTGEFNFDRVNYWQIKGVNLPGPAGYGDTVFLRGRGDDKDKFVRVDIPKDREQLPRVTIYRLRNVREEMIETTKEEQDEKIKLPELGSSEKKSKKSWRPSWKKDGDYDGSYSLSDTEQFKLHVGPKVRMKDYLPNQITLVDFKSKHDLTEESDLEVTGEISTRRREARFSLVGKKGKGEKAWLEVRDDGDYEVGMPYQISIADMPVKGGLLANDGGLGATMVLKETEGGITEARYFNERGKSTFSIDHHRKLNEITTMTLRVSEEEGKGQAWLMFNVNFD